MTVLLDPRHHSKVLWEVSSEDAANALPFQLLGGVQGCKSGEEWEVKEEKGWAWWGGVRGQSLTLVQTVEHQVELLL